MKGYHSNIENLTQENTHFRQVLYTGKHSQLVLMSLKPNEEIGSEVHDEQDQFFRVEAGSGKAVVGEVEYTLTDGDVVIVPAGVRHNIINISADQPLKLYTLYSPPHHEDGTIHMTKADAEADTEEFNGVTTE